MIDSIAATPGVKAVTVSENGLFSGTDSLSDDGIEGYTPRTDADRSNHSDRVGPDYFQIVGCRFSPVAGLRLRMCRMRHRLR